MDSAGRLLVEVSEEALQAIELVLLPKQRIKHEDLLDEGVRHISVYPNQVLTAYENPTKSKEIG